MSSTLELQVSIFGEEQTDLALSRHLVKFNEQWNCYPYEHEIYNDCYKPLRVSELVCIVWVVECWFSKWTQN